MRAGSSFKDRQDVKAKNEKAGSLLKTDKKSNRYKKLATSQGWKEAKLEKNHVLTH